MVTTVSVALGPLLPLPGTVVFQKVEFARRLAFRKTQHCSIHCFAKGRRFVKKLKRLFWTGNQRQGFSRPAKSYQCDLGKSTTSLGLRFLVFSKVRWNEWFLTIFWFANSFEILMKEMNSLSLVINNYTKICVWFHGLFVTHPQIPKPRP